MARPAGRLGWRSLLQARAWQQVRRSRRATGSQRFASTHPGEMGNVPAYACRRADPYSTPTLVLRTELVLAR